MTTSIFSPVFRVGLLSLFLISFSAWSQIKVEDYYEKSHKDDWGPAFSAAFKAMEAKGHGTLELDGMKEYRFRSCAELPRYAKGGEKGMYIINGNGATLRAIVDSVYIFNRIPKNQKEALNQMMKSRFTIKDISFIGGAKGINLGATYQSSIHRCNFKGQNQASVDIQFGLQTVISHCNSLHAGKDNFILRTGEDWGGTSINSQSNHSVIEYSRVYARKDAKTAFKVLGSSGVVLRDLISEGSSEIDYSIYIDRMGSSTVRLFKLENLHLEHAPRKAGIYTRSTGITTLDGIFYQIGRKEGFTLIHAGPGADQINLKNVPHFVKGTIIKQEQPGGGASWVLESCKKEFFSKNIWHQKTKDGWIKKLPYYFKGTGYRYNTKNEY